LKQWADNAKRETSVPDPLWFRCKVFLIPLGIGSSCDPDRQHSCPEGRAELESPLKRRLCAALQSGRKFKGDFAISFYQQFGMPAKTLDGMHRQLKAKRLRSSN
jgi:hypothetical protein